MKTRIIGIGNGGCNIVDDLRKVNLTHEVEFVYYDYESEELRRHGNDNDCRILLDIGHPADIPIADNKVDVTIVASALGGRATTMFSEKISLAYRQLTGTMVGAMTLPFKTEGTVQCEKAKEFLKNLKASYDVSIIQDNDKLPGGLNVIQMNLPLCEAVGTAINKFSNSQQEDNLKALLIEEVQSQCLIIE
ncbi:MAG: hypothetical protein J1D85_06805 [Bacteroidales bacterium]|nr:hypothetical protein [Bacteroidales bacterium]